MKAILIDAAKREIREVEYQPIAIATDVLTLQQHIGGFIEAAYRWDNCDVLYVDEEGLLKQPQHFFSITVRPDQPLAGNGIVVGIEVEDQSATGFHTEPPSITVEELRAIVTFDDLGGVT